MIDLLIRGSTQPNYCSWLIQAHNPSQQGYTLIKPMEGLQNDKQSIWISKNSSTVWIVEYPGEERGGVGCGGKKSAFKLYWHQITTSARSHTAYLATTTQMNQ